MSDRRYTYTLDKSTISSSNIVIQMRCYPMSEDKFNTLISSSAKLGGFSKDILLIGVGIAFKIVAVWVIYIYNGYQGNTGTNVLAKVESWEYASLFACLGFALLLKIVSLAIVSDRDALIKEIRQFYKDEIK